MAHQIHAEKGESKQGISKIFKLLPPYILQRKNSFRKYTYVDSFESLINISKDIQLPSLTAICVKHEAVPITSFINVSIPKNDYIIDTIRLYENIQNVESVFQKANILKQIFGINNSAQLIRDFESLFRNIFDVQIKLETLRQATARESSRENLHERGWCVGKLLDGTTFQFVKSETLIVFRLMDITKGGEYPAFRNPTNIPESQTDLAKFLSIFSNYITTENKMMHSSSLIPIPICLKFLIDKSRIVNDLMEDPPCQNTIANKPSSSNFCNEHYSPINNQPNKSQRTDPNPVILQRNQESYQENDLVLHCDDELNLPQDNFQPQPQGNHSINVVTPVFHVGYDHIRDRNEITDDELLDDNKWLAMIHTAGMKSMINNLRRRRQYLKQQNRKRSIPYYNQHSKSRKNKKDRQNRRIRENSILE